ncbi:MAG: hypothetical protein Q9199_002764 [Rusavskia elegans]
MDNVWSNPQALIEITPGILAWEAVSSEGIRSILICVDEGQEDGFWEERGRSGFNE